VAQACGEVSQEVAAVCTTKETEKHTMAQKKDCFGFGALCGIDAKTKIPYTPNTIP